MCSSNRIVQYYFFPHFSFFSSSLVSYLLLCLRTAVRVISPKTNLVKQNINILYFFFLSKNAWFHSCFTSLACTAAEFNEIQNSCVWKINIQNVLCAQRWAYCIFVMDRSFLIIFIHLKPLLSIVWLAFETRIWMACISDKLRTGKQSDEGQNRAHSLIYIYFDTA